MEELRREDAVWFKEVVERALNAISSIIVGKRKELEMIIATLLAEGHVLLEGVPGVAKTLIARCVAQVFDLEFRRIQVTPDMLPTDIIGFKMYDPKKVEFVLRKGPIFANIVLVDEINRAPPKTQAALLEAMQERQVTIEGETLKLPRPFMVIATMNPVEVEGTFPLSEAQIDRFLSKVRIGYPTIDETVEILKRYDRIVEGGLKPVISREELVRAMNLVKKVRVDENILRYIALIVEETRKHPSVRLGASPRGAIALYLLSRAIALMRGRAYVTPDDVKYVAHVALEHRIVLKTEARISGIDASTIIDEVLDKVEPP